MRNYFLCLTAVSKRKDAERIARRLVAKKLAACVNVVPAAVSFYVWKGKLCRDREYLLLMKTSSSRLKVLQKELTTLHPYDLPEFISLRIDSGSKAYLNWMSENLGKR